MKKFNFLKFIIILLGIIAVYFYFFHEKFSQYNLEKSISACIVAQKRPSESFDFEKSKKYYSISEIHLVCSKYNSQVAKNYNFIDKIFIVNQPKKILAIIVKTKKIRRDRSIRRHRF